MLRNAWFADDWKKRKRAVKSENYANLKLKQYAKWNSQLVDIQTDIWDRSSLRVKLKIER